MSKRKANNFKRKEIVKNSEEEKKDFLLKMIWSKKIENLDLEEKNREINLYLEELKELEKIKDLDKL